MYRNSQTQNTRARDQGRTPVGPRAHAPRRSRGQHTLRHSPGHDYKSQAPPGRAHAPQPHPPHPNPQHTSSPPWNPVHRTAALNPAPQTHRTAQLRPKNPTVHPKLERSPASRIRESGIQPARGAVSNTREVARPTLERLGIQLPRGHASNLREAPRPRPRVGHRAYGNPQFQKHRNTTSRNYRTP
jgi:hypothetical protein